MPKLIPEIETYIKEAQDFAKPILKHWAKLILDTCPDADQAIKWSYPHFDYKGQHMCVLAAYKNHCSFMFMKASLMSDPRLKENATLKAAQRFLGKVTDVSELLPDKEFIKFIKEAMVLNENGVKVVRAKSATPKVVNAPDVFLKALAKNAKAKTVYESKSPSFRKNYNIWIGDAKTDETRERRIAEAIGWIAEGKGRFWKSEK